MLIAIEGLDGCGKTTLAKLLAARLAGPYLKFPNRETSSGRCIDLQLRHRIVMWPESFQALQIVNRIEQLPTLTRSKGSPVCHCVCDRYTASAVVYGMQDGLSEADLRAWSQSLPEPDLNILLSVDPACIDGERLKGRDREVYENRGLKGLEDQARRFEKMWMEHDASPRWRVFIGPERSPQDLVTVIGHIIVELGGTVPTLPTFKEVPRG